MPTPASRTALVTALLLSVSSPALAQDQTSDDARIAALEAKVGALAAELAALKAARTAPAAAAAPAAATAPVSKPPSATAAIANGRPTIAHPWKRGLALRAKP